MSFKKNILTFLFFLNILFIIIIWFLNNHLSFTTKFGSLIALGRITALLGTYLILIQLLLIGKITWIEDSFGQDKLSRIHHLNGIIAFILISLHGYFLTLAYGIYKNISFLSQFMQFLGNDEIAGGIIGLAILLIVILTSILLSKLNAKYETWYILHLLSYLAILLAFSHQLERGYDLHTFTLQVYWILLYLFVVVVFAVWRFAIPVIKYAKHRFYVSNIVAENDSTVSIYISGNNMPEFKYSAGQFIVIRFLDRKRYLQAHPFSISSVDKDYIRLTIKSLGDFTKEVSTIKKDTKVVIEGPLGRFTSKSIVSNRKDLVFIAGGVGITPVRSLIEEILSDKTNPQKLKLIYSVRSESDILFLDELSNLVAQNNSRLSISYIITEKEGHLDKNKLESLISNFKDKEFFICGPESLSKSITRILIQEKINRKNIHSERFSF